MALDLLQEFDKQVETLIQKGYPKLAHKTESEFINILSDLRNKVAGLSDTNIDITQGSLPFVIVVKSNLVSTEDAMSVVQKDNKNGVVKLFPLVPSDFTVIESVSIPKDDVYLLIDIDRGKKSLNVTPKDALVQIKNKNRSPLTIEEGVALVTHYPEFLIKNNCFSLLASRHQGDQRVPAIWINAAKNPNLGWCWNGNPHTWLGSASCKKRIG